MNKKDVSVVVLLIVVTFCLAFSGSAHPLDADQLQLVSGRGLCGFTEIVTACNDDYECNKHTKAAIAAHPNEPAYCLSHGNCSAACDATTGTYQQTGVSLMGKDAQPQEGTWPCGKKLGEVNCAWWSTQNMCRCSTSEPPEDVDCNPRKFSFKTCAGG